VLEGIAFQVADLVAAMAESGLEFVELRADGGASVNDALLQFQADILGIPVVRAAEPECTALGAACLAGLAVGLWRDAAEVHTLLRPARRFVPDPTVDRATLLARWRRAVAAVRRFGVDEGGR
jgi:glycerol kinase